MNIYQAQLDKYVFDLPGIGLVSFIKRGLILVYKNITFIYIFIISFILKIRKLEMFKQIDNV